MQSFKEFLKEDTNPDWFLTNKKEIESLASEKRIQQVRVFSDLSVSTLQQRTMNLTEENMLEINGKYFFGFQLQQHMEWIDIKVHGDIGSLRGLPPKLQICSLYLDAKSIVFDFLPEMLDATLYLGNKKLESLKGIGKAKTSLNIVMLGANIKTNVLGLMLHDFAKNQNSHPVRPLVLDTAPISKAALILTRHITGDNDIMDCHEELTRAGLKDYAKL